MKLIQCRFKVLISYFSTVSLSKALSLNTITNILNVRCMLIWDIHWSFKFSAFNVFYSLIINSEDHIIAYNNYCNNI